jgi:hypothetical protein
MKSRSVIKYGQANRLLLLSLITFCIISVLPCLSQKDTTDQKQPDKESQANYWPLFGTDDVLEVFLRFNLSSFLKKTDKNQSFNGDMTIYFSDTDSVEKNVTVKYRGENRFERCRIPPMRITFKKPLYEASDSGKVKKMKLVNPCQPGVSYENYVIKEYLVYKLYSVLTDTCFRVRLVKINFIDSEKKKKPITQYGIFVEPEELLAKRTNILEVKSTSMSQRHMFPAMIDRIAIFNYMISNWDWSVAGQHNISVFSSQDYNLGGLGIPVPFDFDLCGIVNADYSIPPPGMGIESNRDRMFTGICRSREVYQEELLMFLDKKDDFYSVINDYPYLDKGAKKDITVFLDQFFSQLEKQKSLERLIDLFLESCQK